MGEKDRKTVMISSTARDLPEVEINPKDEFWVDPDRLDELLEKIIQGDE